MPELSKLQPHREATTSPQLNLFVVALLVIALQSVINAAAITNIVTQGKLASPDDFLHMVQVRDFLSGQGWYDVNTMHMLPPNGAELHWSRLLDVPLAAITWLGNFLFEMPMAERITAIIWPLLLLAASSIILVKISDRLVGISARPFVLFGLFLSVTTQEQFSPGRVDHHNLQILLYLAMLLSLIHWRSTSANLGLAILVPLSLAIGLDNIILLAMVLIWVVWEWVAGSDQKGLALKRFSLALIPGAILLGMVSVPPQAWFATVCDAYSSTYLTALLFAGASMLAMAYSTPFITGANTRSRLVWRMAIAALLGLFSLAFVLTLFPECREGPYGQISEQLRTRWLSEVNEAKSLPTILSEYPEYWFKIAGFGATAIMVSIWVFLALASRRRIVAILLAGFVLSTATAFIQYRAIRAGYFVMIPMGAAGIFLAQHHLTRWLDKKPTLLPVARIAVILILGSSSWAFVANTAKTLVQPARASLASVEVMQPTTDSNPVCFSQSHYEQLKDLPKGLVMSDLNSAPALIYFTPHWAFMGPYHRNGNAILAVQDFFHTDGLTARYLAEKLKIDYVGICTHRLSNTEIEAIKHNPDSLMRQIYLGQTPEWLEPISPPSDKFKVFRFKPS